MDNKQNYQGNITLPPLGGETVKPIGENYNKHSSQEVAKNNSDLPQTVMPPIDINAINFAPPAGPVGQAGASTSAVTSSNDAAESSIPKEWIVKAKAVISQTHDDPHVQNLEINKLKAQYMKKLYNIDIKIPDDES